MSSNMIKAYSIAYDTNKTKKLDTEEREKKIEERLQTLLPFRPFLEEQINENEVLEQEFVPGLIAEDLGELVMEEPEAPEVPQVDLEAIRMSLREEVTNEIALEYQKQGGEILAKAQEQADEFLAAAKQDAETAKESILKIASAQGYEEGLKRAKAEEDRLRRELEEEKLRLQQEYERQVSELEPAFVKILKDMVKKVTGVAYDYHDETLMYLISTGVEQAKKDESFEVVLNEGDFERFEKYFGQIKEQLKDRVTLEFRKEVDAPVGSCRLENENCVIHCGLDTGLQGLLEELELLG